MEKIKSYLEQRIAQLEEERLKQVAIHAETFDMSTQVSAFTNSAVLSFTRDELQTVLQLLNEE